MNHHERVALIRAGVTGAGATWAELGAGSGAFTAALRDLLPPDGVLHAVDRDQHALEAQRAWLATAPSGAEVILHHADFTQPLPLPPLDGLLMANALHFVRDPVPLLARLVGHLKAGGCFLLVEYEVATWLPWVPFPVPLSRFAALAARVGLSEPERVGFRRSPSSGIAMYAARATRPH